MVKFIEHYQTVKGCKSRSQVIEEALVLLQEKELEVGSLSEELMRNVEAALKLHLSL